MQKTKKVLFNQKKVRTFAPDFAGEKHRFFEEIVAETNSLLNCRTRLGYRGFESPLLRQAREKDVHEASFFLTKATGYGVVRLARLLWEQEIACSNQAIPTSERDNV